jgi:hypothetical protein
MGTIARKGNNSTKITTNRIRKSACKASMNTILKIETEYWRKVRLDRRRFLKRHAIGIEMPKREEDAQKVAILLTISPESENYSMIVAPVAKLNSTEAVM